MWQPPSDCLHRLTMVHGLTSPRFHFQIMCRRTCSAGRFTMPRRAAAFSVHRHDVRSVGEANRADRCGGRSAPSHLCGSLCGLHQPLRRMRSELDLARFRPRVDILSSHGARTGSERGAAPRRNARQDASPPAGCSVEAQHPSQTPCGNRVMTKMSTRGLKRAKCRSLLMRRSGWCSPRSEPHKCDGAEHPPHRSAWFATPTERISCRSPRKAAPHPSSRLGCGGTACSACPA
jgi:hypothetical protein